MKSRLMTITPSVAADMLTKNHSNRKINFRVVDGYADDMSEGNWAPSHQGIAFNREGHLVDGQHRLMAIIQSNVTIELYVFFDVTQTPNMDRGLPRTIKNCLEFDGATGITTRHIAVMSSALGTSTLRVSEAEKFKRYYGEELDFIVSISCTKKFLKAAPILAAMLLAKLNHVHDDVLIHFSQVLSSGMPTRDTDVTIINFRNKLLSYGAMGSQKDRSNLLKLTMRVIHAVKKEETLKNLYVPDNYIYPLIKWK